MMWWLAATTMGALPSNAGSTAVPQSCAHSQNETALGELTPHGMTSVGLDDVKQGADQVAGRAAGNRRH